MNRRRITSGLISVLALVASAPLARAQETVIPQHGIWRYQATGTDLGTAWRGPAYVDASWPQGAGLLGYGESYIDTVIPYGPSASNKYRTTYFRFTFNLNLDPGDVTSLRMTANYDDGFVAYLNGTEIARRAMPAGTVVYATFASSHESGTYETVDLTGAAGELVPGANVLAVEVHQTSAGSSDLAWDAWLTVSTLPALVTRGPYLQVGTPAGVIVRWRTDVLTSSRVRYGDDPAALTYSVQDTVATTEHEMALTGLAPETRVFYAVGTLDTTLAGDSTYAFTTAPPAGTRRPVRAWIIGDSGTADANAAAVRDAYLAYAGAHPADLWLMLGDNAYTAGTDAQYQAAVFDTYPAVLRSTVLWPTRGNHDQLYSGTGNDYYDIFTLPTAGQAGGLASGTEAYYSFDYADVHFVCLDSEGSNLSPGSAMFTWLADDLAATDQDWLLAFWHHPPYTKGSHDSDNDGDSGGRMRDMRENALPVLEAGGVDLVLSGHSHSYERSMLLDGHYGYSWTLADSMKVDPGDGRLDGDGAYRKPSQGPAPHEGAVYVVAGSSGKTSGGSLNHPVMLVNRNVLGSVILDVDGDQLDAVFLDAAGAPEDHFTVVKGTAVGIGDPPLPVAGPTLETARPNPFSHRARIRYTLPAAGRVEIAVFDVSGRRVATLVDGSRPAGEHETVWDGRDEAGRTAVPGVYFTVLDLGGERRVRKLVLSR